MFHSCSVMFLLMGVFLFAVDANPSCAKESPKICLIPYTLATNEVLPNSMAQNDSISEYQLKRLCIAFRESAVCLRDFATRCFPNYAPELHVVMQGTVDLLGVCDRENIYSEAMAMMDCYDKFSEKSNAANVCVEKMNRYTLVPKNEEFLAGLFLSGQFRRNVCTPLNETMTCLLPEFAKCNQHAQTLNKAMNRAILNTYCNDSSVINSSTSPSPTPKRRIRQRNIPSSDFPGSNGDAIEFLAIISRSLLLGKTSLSWLN